VALLLAAVAAMRWHAYRREPDHEGGSGEFLLSRYRLMERLLAGEDFLFLAAQPGYRPEIGAKLRRERRRIFRLYLRELAGDFRRLHAEARRMIANSTAEHSELVGVLMRQQLTFRFGLAAIELRLALNGLGLGLVDVRGLVDSVEAMRLDLARFLASAPAPL